MPVAGPLETARAAVQPELPERLSDAMRLLIGSHAAVAGEAFECCGKESRLSAADLAVTVSGGELLRHPQQGLRIGAGRENVRQQASLGQQVGPPGRGTGVKHHRVEIDDFCSSRLPKVWFRSCHRRRLTPHIHESSAAPATHDRCYPNRPLRLLAFACSMAEVRGKGVQMIQDTERGRLLAQNLVELLAPYEEELIQIERDVPAFGPLRRALGIAIAEACYCISDTPPPQDNLVPPADDAASRAR